MPNISAILIILAALWASVRAKANMFAVVNERRDTILTGYFEGQPLSLEHRRLIFERDWRPIVWGTVTISAVFALVVISIPYLLSDLESIRLVAILCFLVAAYNALAAFATARHVVFENKFIESRLKALERLAAPTAESTSLPDGVSNDS